MKVIGLTGNAGAGKDYTYLALEQYFGHSTVTRVSLADEVRFEIQETLTPRQHLSAVWEKPYSFELRSLLQWWGTELRRSKDEDYWVNKTEQTIDGIRREGTFDIAVVTDVRFGNEADMVRETFGGIVAEVEASRETRAERLGGNLPPAHSSEVIDFPVDGYVWNADHPVLSQSVAAYLDLPKGCVECRHLKSHINHGFPLHIVGA